MLACLPSLPPHPTKWAQPANNPHPARPPRCQAQVNAGQANAATGAPGYQDSLASADAVAAALGVARDDVLLESTGVIGRRIKMEQLLAAVPKLAAALGSGAEDAHRAAVAITTTDLVSKASGGAGGSWGGGPGWVDACAGGYGWVVVAITTTDLVSLGVGMGG